MISGCGGGPIAKPEGVPVSGRVLLASGSPLTGGTLVLKPEDGLFGAIGQIQSDGRFTLNDAGGPNIVCGKYQVFIRFANSNQSRLKSSVHQRYQQNSDDGDSGLVVEIKEATEELTIRLRS